MNIVIISIFLSLVVAVVSCSSLPTKKVTTKYNNTVVVIVENNSFTMVDVCTIRNGNNITRLETIPPTQTVTVNMSTIMEDGYGNVRFCLRPFGQQRTNLSSMWISDDMFVGTDNKVIITLNPGYMDSLQETFIRVIPN